MNLKEIFRDQIFDPLRVKNAVADLRDEAFRVQYGNGANPDTSLGVMPQAVEQFSRDPLIQDLAQNYYAALAIGDKNSLNRLAAEIEGKSLAQKTAIAQLVVGHFNNSPQSKKLGAKLIF